VRTVVVKKALQAGPYSWANVYTGWQSTTFSAWKQMSGFSTGGKGCQRTSKENNQTTVFNKFQWIGELDQEMLKFLNLQAHTG
jgi:hypothetical protein